MADSERVERFWWSRLRWRMRGAWLWPAFLVLTPLEGILLSAMPPYDGAPAGVIGGILVAGFANLFLIAVLAPLAGRRWRRRRPDRPRVVAADQAGTALLCSLAAIIAVAGVLHRPAEAARRADLTTAYEAAHDFVLARAPAYTPGLASVDTLRLADEAYRICVPGTVPGRRLCLYVDTDHRPPAVRRDTSTEPNSSLRTVGGFH